MRAAESAPEDHGALLALFRAIAGNETDRALGLIDRAPSIAYLATAVGATRQLSQPYFLRTICHYVYAGDTALHIAAAAYGYRLAHELVARGANPRARNRRGAEPLHYAADGVPGSRTWNPAAQEAIVQCLVKSGANPNATDNSGVFPLHRAVRTRCAAAVRALLVNGAEPRCKNGSGSTPLHLAAKNTGRGGIGSPEAQEQQKEIIGLLLQHGASPADRDGQGKTAADGATSRWVRELLAGHALVPDLWRKPLCATKGSIMKYVDSKEYQKFEADLAKKMARINPGTEK